MVWRLNSELLPFLHHQLPIWINFIYYFVNSISGRLHSKSDPIDSFRSCERYILPYWTIKSIICHLLNNHSVLCVCTFGSRNTAISKSKNVTENTVSMWSNVSSDKTCNLQRVYSARHEDKMEGNTCHRGRCMKFVKSPNREYENFIGNSSPTHRFSIINGCTQYENNFNSFSGRTISRAKIIAPPTIVYDRMKLHSNTRSYSVSLT